MGLLESIGWWAAARRHTREDASVTTNASCPAPAEPRAGWVRTLGAIVETADLERVVRKSDLQFGDRVVVSTRNSVYSLWTLGDGCFAVTGGWFDQHCVSPFTITVNGCTYGGRAIWHDVVAAPGLFLEFGNNVSTTRIQSVRVERFGSTTDESPQSAVC